MKNLPALRGASKAVFSDVVRTARAHAYASAYRAQGLRERLYVGGGRAAELLQYSVGRRGHVVSASSDLLEYFDDVPLVPRSFVFHACRAGLVLLGAAVALAVCSLPSLWWATALQYLDALE